MRLESAGTATKRGVGASWESSVCFSGVGNAGCMWCGLTSGIGEEALFKGQPKGYFIS